MRPKIANTQTLVFEKTIKVGSRVPAEARWPPYGADRVPRQRGGSGTERRVRSATHEPLGSGAASRQTQHLASPVLGGTFSGRACPTPFCCFKPYIVCWARRLTNSCMRCRATLGEKKRLSCRQLAWPRCHISLAASGRFAHVCTAANCRHSTRSCFFLARDYLPARAGQRRVQGRLQLLSFLVVLLCFDRRWLLIDDRTIGQRFLRRLMRRSYCSVLCQVRHRYALWIRTHFQPGIDMVELNRKARPLLRNLVPVPRLRASTRLPSRPSASFFYVVSGIAAVTSSGPGPSSLCQVLDRQASRTRPGAVRPTKQVLISCVSVFLFLTLFSLCSSFFPHPFFFSCLSSNSLHLPSFGELPGGHASESGF